MQVADVQLAVAEVGLRRHFETPVGLLHHPSDPEGLVVSLAAARVAGLRPASSLASVECRQRRVVLAGWLLGVQLTNSEA